MGKEEKNLQTALKQLEGIVGQLSQREVDVEEGLEKFKEGVALIRFCREQLKKAENEFKKIKSELESEKEQSEAEVEEVSDDNIPF